MRHRLSLCKQLPPASGRRGAMQLGAQEAQRHTSPMPPADPRRTRHAGHSCCSATHRTRGLTVPREERNCSRDLSVCRAGSSQGHRGQARPSSPANPMNRSASLCPGMSRTQRLSPRDPLPGTCLRVSRPPPNPLPLGTGAVQGDKGGVRATQKLSPWGGCSGESLVGSG